MSNFRKTGVFDRFAQIGPFATICNGTGTGASKSAIVNVSASLFEPGMRIGVCKPDGEIRGYFHVSYVDNVGPGPLSRWRRFINWLFHLSASQSVRGVIYSEEILPEGTTVGDYIVGEGQ